MVVACVALAPWRLLAAELAPRPPIATTELQALIDAKANAVLPLVPLHPAGTRLEADWADALAEALHGQQEVRIEHGRIDVLSASYAIEVDWFAKWHEGLGQAAHYSVATGKAPAVALILKPAEWPLSAHTLSKLAVIQEVANALGIEVFLLRAVMPERTAMRR
jgi:hypothetical protein